MATLINHASGDVYLVEGVLCQSKDARIVYAVNLRTAEEVAIKVYPKPKIFTETGRLTDVAREHRVFREVTELRRPFLVQMLSSLADAVNVYFVMVSTSKR